MVDLRSIVVACSALLCMAAHAGYAQLTPPPGFGGGGAGPFTFAASAAANQETFGRVIHQAAGPTTNVGGQLVRMSASYRFAANAPLYAARAIFLNPYVAAGVGIAAWLAASKLSWDSASKQWVKAPDGDGYEYSSADNLWYSSAQAACAAGLAYQQAQGRMHKQIVADGVDMVQNRCIYRWSYGGTYAGQGAFIKRAVPPGQSTPVTQAQFESILNPANQVGWPMPSTVPLELPPGTALPVEQPFINPAPGESPAHRPMFVPSGNPVPNPNFNPELAPGPGNQPFIQPGVRIVPTPTASNPWQVSLEPVDRPVASAEPSPDPTVEQGPGSEDKPREEKSDLCEKYPDILACQKLDQPEEEKLKTVESQFEFTPESGFSGAGVCPAPINVALGGQQFSISWQPFCNSLSMIRPLVLAFAWLAAAFIILGARSD